ncbi:hypothetical protein [Nonomuraea fuscirosea]|uniref:hypothetical protein n=1 Tax=Nonomuraea fuscirosea TaxID=1291556 RepID=UPI0033CA007F
MYLYLALLINIARYLGLSAVLGTILLTGAAIAGIYIQRVRERAAIERELAARRLAAARDRVLRSVDIVMDPSLTEDERLLIIDEFIPEFRAQGVPDPRYGSLNDRFVVVNDLLPKFRLVLERVRKAALTVYGSDIKRMGLLDGVANDVILPRETWEIAQLLLRQTFLIQRQLDARRGVALTTELKAVLAPQEAALLRSFEATLHRVSIVEEYARRVQEADAALRAQALLGDNDRYRALLAQTDDVEGMRYLSRQSLAVSDVLAKSVREAVETGQTLTLPLGSRYDY